MSRHSDDYAGRRPCPRHPEHGDVDWLKHRQTSPTTGNTIVIELPSCRGCAALQSALDGKEAR